MIDRSRPRVRVMAAVLVAAVPLSMASFARALDGSDDGDPGDHRAAVAAGVLPFDVEPETTIAGSLSLLTAADRNRKISLSSSKGSRTWTASELAEHDLPSAAMRAYRAAARSINASEPGCSLHWTLLAGIGRVESDHGRYGGSELGADGVPRPAIVGIPLNGVGPVAAIRDTDGGRFDGDTVWDRAVGPMQFIPSTWQSAGRDGDRDGSSSPNDIDDAALAAASYLCADERDLSQAADQRAALFSYNHSDYYVDLVSAFARGYRSGTFTIPSPAVSPDAGDGVVPAQDEAGTSKAAKAKVEAAKAAKAKAAKAKAAAEAKAKAAKKAKDKAPKPTPKPTPKPSPTPKPAPTTTSQVSGVLATGPGSSWVVAGTTFTAVQAAGVAAEDLDGDGQIESVPAELDGVVEREGTVRVHLSKTGSKVTVTEIEVLALAPVASATASPSAGSSS